MQCEVKCSIVFWPLSSRILLCCFVFLRLKAQLSFGQYHFSCCVFLSDKEEKLSWCQTNKVSTSPRLHSKSTSVKPTETLLGQKRPTTWRDTRAHQKPSGADPDLHDDFLDTPIEMARTSKSDKSSTSSARGTPVRQEPCRDKLPVEEPTVWTSFQNTNLVISDTLVPYTCREQNLYSHPTQNKTQSDLWAINPQPGQLSIWFVQPKLMYLIEKNLNHIDLPKPEPYLFKNDNLKSNLNRSHKSATQNMQKVILSKM